MRNKYFVLYNSKPFLKVITEHTGRFAGCNPSGHVHTCTASLTGFHPVELVWSQRRGDGIGSAFPLSSERLLHFCLLVENPDISTPAGAQDNGGFG